MLRMNSTSPKSDPPSRMYQQSPPFCFCGAASFLLRIASASASVTRLHRSTGAWAWLAGVAGAGDSEAVVAAAGADSLAALSQPVINAIAAEITNRRVTGTTHLLEECLSLSSG